MRRLAFGILVGLALLGIASPGAAQSPSDGPSAAVRFVSVTPWNDATRPLAVSLEVRNTSPAAIEEPSVRLTIYRRVNSRSGLRAALDGHPQQDVLAVATEQLADAIAAGQTVPVTVDRELGQLASVFRKGRKGGGGVYPIEIDVQGSGRTLATGWTAMVFFSTTPDKRLNVSWVLPLRRPPMLEPDGRGAAYDAAAVDRAVGSHGDVTKLVAALAAHESVPITLAPSGLFLDELSDISNGYLRVQGPQRTRVAASDATPRAAAAALESLKSTAAAGGFEIALAPYSGADMVSLVHGDLANDAARQLSEARARVGDVLGVPPDSGLLVPAALAIDARSATAVAQSGVQTVVVDPALLPAQPGLFGPEGPVTVTALNGVQLNALLADAPIRERLANGLQAKTDSVLLAQATLAETASSWFERPSLAAGRAIVVATDSTLPAEVVAPLADGLASAPWLQMRKASELPGIVPPGEPPQALPLGSDASRGVIAAARQARRAVDVLTRVVVAPAGATSHLDRLVLAAEAAGIVQSQARSLEFARAARAEAERTLGRIRPAARQVTLTSRTGQLPVTIVNDTGFTVSVRVRVSSAKVRFPSGDEKTVEIGDRNATLSFPARALATGAFAVDVRILTPDGGSPIGGNQVVVRSTAVSAVALAVTGGAALFLLIAWMRRSMRRRSAVPQAG